MRIVARMVTQEHDGIPGYMAHPDAPGTRPGIMMVHHAHGVTADYKIDAYRLAQLGFNVLVPSLFNMFGIPGYAAYHDGPGLRPGVLMAHHAHGVTADYKIDAYRLAQLGFNVLVQIGRAHV